jgi:hypothetical protein
MEYVSLLAIFVISTYIYLRNTTPLAHPSGAAGSMIWTQSGERTLNLFARKLQVSDCLETVTDPDRPILQAYTLTCYADVTCLLQVPR